MRENLTSGSRWQGMETKLITPRRHSLTLPRQVRFCATYRLSFTSGLYCSQAESTLRPLAGTQTVSPLSCQEKLYETNYHRAKEATN